MKVRWMLVSTVTIVEYYRDQDYVATKVMKSTCLIGRWGRRHKRACLMDSNTIGRTAKMRAS
jgi:hypothetical protein